MGSARLQWVLLAYRLPRDPSTPRSALWRKLRQLGAVQVLDGLAALPLDARNREQLEWLAEGVVEAGGVARQTVALAPLPSFSWSVHGPTVRPLLMYRDYGARAAYPDRGAVR